ncbi:hypothetical protein Dimus_023057 [Dionaea muscipula]
MRAITEKCMPMIPICRLGRVTPQISPCNIGNTLCRSTSTKSHNENSTPDPAEIRRYNILLNGLGRQGQPYEARRLFDEMPQRDTVSYGTMITSYLKNHDLPSAEKFFLEMPNEFKGVVVDTAMINGYARACRLDDARFVFDRMPQRNAFSWTSMISGYFCNGYVAEAVKLFDQMPGKNVVSWTSVVLGYARNGLVYDARRAFDRMPEKNVVSWTVMIKAYIENDLIEEALNLFYEMPCRNLYTWNQMISGCLENNRVDDAVRLFNSMPTRNSISWTIMVSGLTKNDLIKQAREYFDSMPGKDMAAWNAMITAYAVEGLMIEANMLFSSAPKKGAVTWNAMIDGYARIGNDLEASKHLITMLKSGVRPTDATITSMLACRHGMLELGEAHAFAIKLGLEQYTSLAIALIHAYSRTGDLRSANVIFRRIEMKDTMSWAVIISAYSSHGQGRQALEALARMMRSGAQLDEITFVAILSACSHCGLVEKGQKLFNGLSHAYGLEPKAEHYACLVDLLGRAGRIEEAKEVVSKMPPCKQDATVLGALLSASRLHQDEGTTDIVGKKLVELEPASSGGYVLLANSYAVCGKWDEFAQMRRMMKKRRIRKVPGYSQIEVNGAAHLFYSGDLSHPELEEIYKCLRDEIQYSNSNGT